MNNPDFYTAAFSSQTGKWDTPADLLADLEPFFPWNLDVCADRPNVCANFFNEETNGLAQGWPGLCWMNPPYGTEIGAWVDKARTESKYFYNTATVCLLPARTDTDWFQRNASDASQRVFIKGRLKFGNRDHWIKHYQEGLLKHSRSRLEGSRQKVYALLDKIGGKLCEPDTRIAMAFFLENDDKKYLSWINADYLKPDAAPFPSCFMTFGYLTDPQQEKLASYGWAI